MGHVYVAKFENVAVSAAQDLFEIGIDRDHPVELHSLFLYNVGADVGDAAEEMLRLTIRYMSDTAGGSGGSTVTALRAKMEPGSPGSVASAAVEANNTSVATTASVSNVVGVGGWNIRMPFERVWTPETRPRFSFNADVAEAGTVLVRLENNPADAINMTGELTFEEVA